MLNSLMSILKIESIILNLFKKKKIKRKALDSVGFTGKFNQIFKRKIILILHNIFQKIEAMGHFLTNFMLILS